MQVLITTVTPFPRTIGVSSYITHLSAALRKRDIGVEVLALHPSRSGFYLTDGTQSYKGKGKYPFSAAQRLRRGDSASHRIEYSLALAELMTTFADRFNIIHAMDPYATLAARQANIAPVVQTLHALPSLRLQMNRTVSHAWKYRAVEKLCLGAADLTLVPSRWLQSEMQNMLPVSVRNRLRHVPLGLDIDRFSAHLVQSRPAFRMTHELILFYPARLSPEKGQKYIIAAMRLLKRKGVRARLWLAGQGPDLISLRRLARRLGVSDRVQFLGQRKDIAPWLKAADIIVVPTIHDNQPFAVIEAQLAGKPVVASKVGGVPEMIVDEETGLLVPAKSPRALADAIIRLHRDRQWGAQMAENARDWAVNAWGETRFIDDTLSAYHEAQEA